MQLSSSDGEKVSEARWNGYRIKPRPGAVLLEHEDGALELRAEHQYLIELPPGAPENESWQALDRLEPGLGLLRFTNYIGECHLGGRSLRVTSNRLLLSEVDQMLDDVVTGLQSLPFSFDTPTSFAYARDVADAEDVPYQAYALLRHALRGVGPYDLAGALDRIVLRPNARLDAIVGDVPLELADRVDAATLIDIVSYSRAFRSVDPDTALAETPLAVALGQRVPDRIHSRRVIETNQTPENEFVVGVLQLALVIVEEFRRAVLRKGGPRAHVSVKESEGITTMLERWRRHPTLADIAPARAPRIESTVLRSRPGYREVTRFFVDLQARTRLLDAADAERLLDARDAALLYEYWCYFQVVDAVASVLHRTPLPASYRVGAFGSSVQHASAADFGAARVWFNRQFSKPKSYSVPLRPDISLELSDGTLHLFDAKLKRDVLLGENGNGSSSTTENDIDEEEKRATYRRGDLYKMHTYRDALGARSVWILYPGRNVTSAAFRPKESAAPHTPSGVGALPLLPGLSRDFDELKALIRQILSSDGES